MALDRLRELRATADRIDYSWNETEQFKEWHLHAELVLGRLFGENSLCLQEFRDIWWFPQVSYVDDPEAVYQQAFVRGLAQARAVLSAAIRDAEDFVPIAISNVRDTAANPPEKRKDEHAAAETFQAMAVGELASAHPRIRRSILVIAGVVVIGFAVWSSLPNETKRELLGRIFGPEPQKSTTPCERPLDVKLDQLLGEDAWFVYPDDNRTEIGVRRIPADFKITGLVTRVDNDDGTFLPGDTVRRPIGSNVALACAWRDAEIPPWQRDAITKWRAAKSADRIGVTRDRVDAIFGNTAWAIVKGFAYAAEGVPSSAVEMVYPITSLDSSNLKYGIGDEDVAPKGGKTRIWFAGDIR